MIHEAQKKEERVYEKKEKKRRELETFNFFKEKKIYR